MEFACGEYDAGSRKKRKNLTLQNYVDFVESQKQSDLTVDLLNKIISIHGFKKLHKVKKEVLIDAVGSIELMDLTRSTLKDDISSCAFISSEEAIKDLIGLNWMECSVTSFKSLNLENHSLISLQNDNITASKLKSGKNKRPKMRRLTEGMEPAYSSASGDPCCVKGSCDCAAADHVSSCSLMVGAGEQRPGRNKWVSVRLEDYI